MHDFAAKAVTAQVINSRRLPLTLFGRHGRRRMWEHLFPAEQSRIVRSLVERVVVGPAGADIRLRLDGLGSLVRDLGAIVPDALRAAA
jgi:hypothetical protein